MFNFATLFNHPVKRLATYGFVLLYLLAMTQPVVPLAEYIIYEDYIAEFLCINKDKKELECNGKCYLMQRLSEQNESKKQNIPKIALEEYPIGFVEFISFTSSLDKQILFQNDFGYHNHYSYLFCPNSYHPPSILS